LEFRGKKKLFGRLANTRFEVYFTGLKGSNCLGVIQWMWENFVRMRSETKIPTKYKFPN
jgi:hypothetical protein